MNTKHTPAPWTVSNYLIGFREDKDLPVCTIIAEINTEQMKSEEEGLANAQLIAAAPELLAALIALLEDVEFAQPKIEGGLIGNRQIRKARAAIEKAQG